MICQLLRWQYNLKVNHKKVLRIMQENGIQSIVRKKQPKKIKENAIIKENLLNRDFKATHPYLSPSPTTRTVPVVGYAVEIKTIELPDTMKRAMAKQAEAERERRAKIIAADGEFQAAQKLLEAASIISKDPSALQLRYLQTLTEIAVEKNSTILFPLPLELLKAFAPKEP